MFFSRGDRWLGRMEGASLSGLTSRTNAADLARLPSHSSPPSHSNPQIRHLSPTLKIQTSKPLFVDAKPRQVKQKCRLKVPEPGVAVVV